jgi:hypothetical protein
MGNFTLAFKFRLQRACRYPGACGREAVRRSACDFGYEEQAVTTDNHKDTRHEDFVGTSIYLVSLCSVFTTQTSLVERFHHRHNWRECLWRT